MTIFSTHRLSQEDAVAWKVAKLHNISLIVRDSCFMWLVWCVTRVYELLVSGGYKCAQSGRVTQHIDDSSWLIFFVNSAVRDSCVWIVCRGRMPVRRKWRSYTTHQWQFVVDILRDRCSVCLVCMKYWSNENFGAQSGEAAQSDGALWVISRIREKHMRKDPYKKKESYVYSTWKEPYDRVLCILSHRRLYTVMVPSELPWE